jgi:hypothetical protein
MIDLSATFFIEQNLGSGLSTPEDYSRSGRDAILA